ncbi:3-oxoacyl-[acyl-carrier-protein] reductase [Eubacterium pyruvativorans]|uniref:3-oxoacyl-[acyl-carrier-protein] reductase n=1 Tax=Eubacterium pyruvativorans TaxID=155865 RepID=UPI0008845850|nr:3-oxoacyl-[acyl-carrier-protein] reductase [Eubacterium pyruvativorans]HAT82203.1 3-oxoacyl-[acyl-carrier-protein] reductase [Eubacterium sp.]MCI5747817.1 3-oxoacyl-[acyl-carrier-protein] reductase [Eubacterium pyruvativorans]MDD6708023.1 3-oxoacyl-[acyl-carrier-protein] reductase [Eubacterium pyruvativorans]MDD7684519.1 3-oxoacyl-[acyl-carrier-protein] reductase [Eubacterium pyruvativorans]MDY4049224.1 3-oxoacyl-[acyl-carrier-protein] reductase [Eubacterium pyruvativorans]
MTERTAIVTGGSRGIGRAVCRKLAERSMNIVMNYSANADAAEEAADVCRSLGARVVTVQGSVAVPEDCDRIVQEALDAFGQVDVLVNSAGITRDNLLLRMSEEDFDQVIAVNLRGTFRMMKAVARPMMRKRYGRIINLSSIVGEMGNAGQVNYAASKAGVNGMTKAFAKEIAGKGITVNAVAPGFIDTDMTRALSREAAESLKARIPMGRLGTPEDVAHVISFLASEEAGYVTGQVIGVNGGML